VKISRNLLRWKIVASHIAHNYVMKIRARLAHETRHGATHENWSVDRSVAYVWEVFTDYLAYGELTPETLAGKTVLEVGPGDNLGVALLFIAAGAERVYALDKFRTQRNEVKEREVYQALRKRLTGPELARFDSAIDLSSGVQFRGDKIQYVCGCGVEEAEAKLGRHAVDLIVSRAVMMELPDSASAFATMDRILRSGGYIVHKIAPLHDYQLFRQSGFHPLEFLTIPACLYRRMVSDSGKPNRKLVDFYRATMNHLGYSSRFHITHVLSSEVKMPPGSDLSNCPADMCRQARALIEAIRPRLDRPFRHLPTADLMIQDFFLTARKQRPCVEPLLAKDGQPSRAIPQAQLSY
jgi:SAM-dependent methyltransferase